MQTYLFGKLDTILDRQAELKTLLLSMDRRPVETEKAKEKESVFSRLAKLPLFYQWIVGGVVSWGVSRAISAYLSNGGSPLELIKLLLGLFV